MQEYSVALGVWAWTRCYWSCVQSQTSINSPQDFIKLKERELMQQARLKALDPTSPRPQERLLRQQAKSRVVGLEAQLDVLRSTHDHARSKFSRDHAVDEQVGQKLSDKFWQPLILCSARYPNCPIGGFDKRQTRHWASMTSDSVSPIWQMEHIRRGADVFAKSPHVTLTWMGYVALFPYVLASVFDSLTLTDLFGKKNVWSSEHPKNVWWSRTVRFAVMAYGEYLFQALGTCGLHAR